MSIDWTLPIRQMDRPDVEGGVHSGPRMVLRAMLDNNGVIHDLSALRISKEDRTHFARQFNAGVRFMVTAEREPSKPIYYKEDGSPWLSHHPALINTPGKPCPLDKMKEAAVRELQKAEQSRRQLADQARDEIMRKKRVERDAEIERNREQDTMESNPLWGAFS